MKRTGPIFLGILLAALLLGLAFSQGQAQGPRVEGRSASYWFRQYARHPHSQVPALDRGEAHHREVPAAFLEAQQALLALGTNLVPYLVLIEAPRKKPLLWRGVERFQARLPRRIQVRYGRWNSQWMESRNAIHQLLDQVRPPGSLLLALGERMPTPSQSSPSAPRLWLAQFCGDGKELLIPLLAEALHSEARSDRLLALGALERFGDEAPAAVVPLIEADFSDSPDFLRWIRALGAFGETAQPALPKLRELFEQEIGGRRKLSLATAICLIDPQPGEALAYLAGRLLDPAWPRNSSFHREVLHDLHKLGPKARPILPVLLEFLETETEPWWRVQALSAVRAMQVAPEPVLERLQAQRSEPRTSKQVLDLAIETLALDPGNPDAIGQLISLLQYERSAHIRTQALWSLENEGAAAASALPVIASLVDDPLLDNQARRARDRIARETEALGQSP